MIYPFDSQINAIEDIPTFRQTQSLNRSTANSGFISPRFAPTFGRSSTPLHANSHVPFNPPSRPTSIPPPPSGNPSRPSSTVQASVPSPAEMDDVKFVSDFRPQKQRFHPYQALIKTEKDSPSPVTDVRTGMSEPGKQINFDDDVEFCFEFQPQKMSTQIPHLQPFRPYQSPITKTEPITVRQR